VQRREVRLGSNECVRACVCVHNVGAISGRGGQVDDSLACAIVNVQPSRKRVRGALPPSKLCSMCVCVCVYVYGEMCVCLK
jgi:hypothetical protein